MGGQTRYDLAFQAAHKHLSTTLKAQGSTLRYSHILFLTDGSPNEDCRLSENIVHNLQRGEGQWRLQDATGRVHRVKTFVVGFGRGLSTKAKSCLNTLARVGGSSRCPAGSTSCTAYYAVDDALLLERAMDSIVQRTVEETCDGIDNDCDGAVDENNPGGGESCKTGRPGPCMQGSTSCQQGKLHCLSQYKSQKETCDGIDNDCDGQIDQSLQKPCYTGIGQTKGVGLCKEGKSTCTGGAWSKCLEEVTPVQETCDGKDNNCDGAIDNHPSCPNKRDDAGTSEAKQPIDRSSLDGYAASVQLRGCGCHALSSLSLSPLFLLLFLGIFFSRDE